MKATVTERIPTGSQWVPELPPGWQLARLQHLASTATSSVDKHTLPGQVAVRLCNYVDVHKNDAITAGLDFMRATATEDQIDRFRVCAGDVIITKDSETADDIGVPAFVEYEAPDLVCGYHLALIRAHPGTTHPKFLYWALSSQPLRDQWAVLASGVTRVGIKSGDLARAAVPLPPLSQQRAIADYLDRETAQIDTLIKEAQHLIALLRERRAEAVRAGVGAAHGSAPGAATLRRAGRLVTGTTPSGEFEELFHPDGVVGWRNLSRRLRPMGVRQPRVLRVLVG